MRKLLALSGSAVLLAWLVWAYGTWVGILPGDLVPLKGGKLMLAFFGTPFLGILLVGMSNWRRNDAMAAVQRNAVRFKPNAWEIAGAIGGGWFLFSFVLMFFTDKYPFFGPIVRWTFIIWIGSFTLTVLGLVLVVVFLQGKGLYQLYREIVDSARLGLFGKVLWALTIATFFAAYLLFGMYK